MAMMGLIRGRQNGAWLGIAGIGPLVVLLCLRPRGPPMYVTSCMVEWSRMLTGAKHVTVASSVSSRTGVQRDDEPRAWMETTYDVRAGKRWWSRAQVHRWQVAAVGFAGLSPLLLLLQGSSCSSTAAITRIRGRSRWVRYIPPFIRSDRLSRPTLKKMRREPVHLMRMTLLSRHIAHGPLLVPSGLCDLISTSAWRSITPVNRCGCSRF